MPNQPITRQTLLDQHLPAGGATARVEIRRITMEPLLAGGAHRHSGAVFGTIERGSAILQIQGEPEITLRPGDVFYEPADAVILRFDATEEGVTFLGYFLLGEGQSPEITML